MFVCPQDAVTELLARTTAQLQAVERELAEERRKLQCSGEQAEAVSERLVSSGACTLAPFSLLSSRALFVGPKTCWGIYLWAFLGNPQAPQDS